MDKKKVLAQVNNLHLKYEQSDESLFENLNFSILQKDKIGIIGPNGIGKTSLLKIIANEVAPTKDKVYNSSKIGYIHQINPNKRKSNQSISEYLSHQSEFWWDIPTQYKKIFKTRLPVEINLKDLSGGEFVKLKIALATHDNPSLLLMDEPTNHLDITGIEYLIEYLNNFNGSLVIVSHNTYFLDQVVNQIWEIDEKKINVYGGNYSHYRSQKYNNIEAKRRKFQEAKSRYKKAKILFDKEHSRSGKMAKKTRKQFLEGSMSSLEYRSKKSAGESFHAAAVIRIKKQETKAADDMKKFAKKNRKLPFINIYGSSKKRKMLFRIENTDLVVAKKQLIRDINFSIRYGDKVCIFGQNGTGKTSLVNAIINPTKTVYFNHSAYLAKDIKIVYLDQNYKIVDPNKNLFENFLEQGHISITTAKTQLGKFKFNPDEAISKAGKDLSGGEFARLSLAIITAFPLDLLILDEPTNNLDIETLDIFATALNNYDGALIIISHNKGFLNEIGIDRYLKTENRQLKICNTL